MVLLGLRLNVMVKSLEYFQLQNYRFLEHTA